MPETRASYIEDYFAQVNKMFDAYDEDGSGTIDFNEFAELITSFNRERYTKVFQSFDVDGSGELDADEV